MRSAPPHPSLDIADPSSLEAGPDAISDAASGALFDYRSWRSIGLPASSSADFRAELVADRSGSGSAPTATVALTTFHRAHSGWQKLASRHLAGSFFWKTVSGPRAICRFELASAVHPHVTVQLLITPSTDCGKTTTLPLPSR